MSHGRSDQARAGQFWLVLYRQHAGRRGFGFQDGEFERRSREGGYIEANIRGRCMRAVAPCRCDTVDLLIGGCGYGFQTRIS